MRTAATGQISTAAPGALPRTGNFMAVVLPMPRLRYCADQLAEVPVVVPVGRGTRRPWLVVVVTAVMVLTTPLQPRWWIGDTSTTRTRAISLVRALHLVGSFNDGATTRRAPTRHKSPSGGVVVAPPDPPIRRRHHLLLLHGNRRSDIPENDNHETNDDDDDDARDYHPTNDLTGAFEIDALPPVVTKEMFWRSLLELPATDVNDNSDDPGPYPRSDDLSSSSNRRSDATTSDSVVVKRAKKNKSSSSSSSSSYKVLDNRDRLPFHVSLTTPDPYTSPSLKAQQAQNNTKHYAPSASSPLRKRRRDAIEDALLPSTLYTSSHPDGRHADDAHAATPLGDYLLDKYTTTGDLLEIGHVQYRVIRHRCQYKYAGGKRFVMTRKLLEVKEIGRLQQEDYLQRAWQLNGTTTTGTTTPSIPHPPP